MPNENPRIITRIRDKSRGYRIWNINEIFFNRESDKLTPGLVVPNQGDLVHEYKGDTLIEYIVVGVDESTDVPKLQTVHRPTPVSREKVFLNGIGNGHLSELHRIFFDPNVQPFTLMVDAGLHYYGEQGMYMKLFRPAEGVGLGPCISQYRTNNGENISENVPLVTLGNRFDDSTAIKRPVVFHTTESLKIGDVLIAVVYNAEGFEARRDNLIVAHGANVRALNASTTYVASVEVA